MIDSLLNDRYLLKDELGRGGMGIVYAARDTLLYRDVAIKVLMSTGLGTEGQARLLQEARAAAGLNHPGIVAVYDVGVFNAVDDDEAIGFIVMEQVKGHTLAKSRPESFERTLDVMDQISVALAHAHSQGVIHRDLKPENIAITDEHQVKLMDFGLAKTNTDRSLEESTGISGSLPYIAPEVILGQPASEQGDLYALGVIFFELLTGRLPFEGDDLAAVLTQLLHSPVTPPSTFDDQIPPLADALTIRLLKKQPHNRPASAGEVRLQLAEIRRSQPEINVVAEEQPGLLNRLVRGRLIGRKKELADLVGMWRQSISNEGHFALISGEPGIGKSRLVRELSSYANLAGGTVLKSECYEVSAIPYMPFAQIIASGLDNVPGQSLPKEVLTDLLALAPDLRLNFPNIQTDLPPMAGSDQQRLFEAVVMLLVAVSNSKPVLLVIDDLHWADSGTLSLLQHLTRRLRQRPIMITGTYREVELSDDRPLKPYLVQFYKERSASRFKLARFDFWETQELIATLFSTGISDAFAESLFKETEGNPFFVEEVCKSLIESGRLIFGDGGWQQGGSDQLEIPQGVRLAIQTRVDKLSEIEQDTLQTAALLGREFEYEVLETISAIDERQLIAILNVAMSAQLIEETDHGLPAGGAIAMLKRPVSFSFTHALIHSTMLESLGTLRRQRRQLAVAQALESAYPERQDHMAPLLAQYFAEAGAAERAIHFLSKSGDSARDVFAYDEAIKAYRQALLFLEEQGDYGHTARTYMKLGLVYHNTFRFEKSRMAYEKGFDFWQKVPLAQEGRHDLPAQTLYTHILQLPTIDPSLSIHFSGTKIIQQLFSGLVEIANNREIVPDIARRWEVLDGGRRYLFFLREDVQWSDGRPLTAADFVFAWRRSLHPDMAEFPAELLYDIRGARNYHLGIDRDPTTIGIQALNDSTLEIELEGPTSYFLFLLSQYIAMPQPGHVIKKWSNNWTSPSRIVSNGPFLLDSWDPGDSIELVRNPGYHGHFSGNLERISVRYLHDPAIAQDLYLREELDCLELVPLLSPEVLQITRHRFPDEYFSSPTSSVTFLAFNLNRPPFDDPQIRRAFAMATDRSSLADVTLAGIYRPATGGFVPPGIPGHSPGVGIPHDPQRAAQLLSESGYPAGRGFREVILRVSSGDIYRSISQDLKVMWKNILGVEVRFAPIGGEENGHITLASVAPEYPDPDSYLRVNSWGPVTGWRNETFNTLVEEARRNPDWDSRMRMYRQAEHLLIEELSLLPLAYGRFHCLLKPWVSKYPLSPLAIPNWKDVLIEERPRNRHA